MIHTIEEAMLLLDKNKECFTKDHELFNKICDKLEEDEKNYGWLQKICGTYVIETL